MPLKCGIPGVCVRDRRSQTEYRCSGDPVYLVRSARPRRVYMLSKFGFLVDGGGGHAECISSCAGERSPRRVYMLSKSGTRDPERKGRATQSVFPLEVQESKAHHEYICSRGVLGGTKERKPRKSVCALEVRFPRRPRGRPRRVHFLLCGRAKPTKSIYALDVRHSFPGAQGHAEYIYSRRALGETREKEP